MVRNLFKPIIIGLFLFLSGCATTYNPATEREEFIFINSATEVAIGEEMVAELTKKYPLSHDQNLQDRVQRIGAKLSEVSDRQDIEYKFFVLEDKELNAMTLPGGFIYVNQGLMNVLDDHELAYVLGHEVGHVAARHIAKKIQSNMAYQLLLSVAFAAAGEKGSGKVEDIAKGVNVLFNLIALGYSRKDEYEADRLAVKYAFKAGFNPSAAIFALEKIRQEEGPNWRLLIYFRTHPYVEERIDALRQIIAQLPPN